MKWLSGYLTNLSLRSRQDRLRVELDGSQVQGFLFWYRCTDITKRLGNCGRTRGTRLHLRSCKSRFGRRARHVDRREPRSSVFEGLKLMKLNLNVLPAIPYSPNAHTSSPVGEGEGAGGGCWAPFGRTKTVLGLGGK